MVSVGIDFGDVRTTVSVIAEHGGRPVETRNEMSQTSTPSAVFFKDGSYKIGQQAAKQITRRYSTNAIVSLQSILELSNDDMTTKMSTDLPSTLRFCDRIDCPVMIIHNDYLWCSLVQRRYFRGHNQAELQEMGFGPTLMTQISIRLVLALFFAKILEPVASKYAVLRSCVVSCSDKYDQRQRELLHESCEMALECLPRKDESAPKCLVEILPSCMAAALYQAKDRPENLFLRSTGRPCPVAFVDIGKTSTSVTIATLDKSGGVVRAIETSETVSGAKIDRKIYEAVGKHLARNFGIDIGTCCKQVRVRIADNCRIAKEELSVADSYEINFDGCFVPGLVENPYTLHSKDLDKMCKDIYAHLKLMCRNVAQSAGFVPDPHGQSMKVHSVELIGNGSLLPSIKNIIMLAFDGVTTRVSVPDEFVSRGCAYRAFENNLKCSNMLEDSEKYDLDLLEKVSAYVLPHRFDGCRIQKGMSESDKQAKYFETRLLQDVQKHEQNLLFLVRSEQKKDFDQQMREIRSRCKDSPQCIGWVEEMQIPTHMHKLAGGISKFETDLDSRLTEIDRAMRQLSFSSLDLTTDLDCLLEKLYVTIIVYKLRRSVLSLPIAMDLHYHWQSELYLGNQIRKTETWMFWLLSDPWESHHETKSLQVMQNCRREVEEIHAILRNMWEIRNGDFEGELRENQARSLSRNTGGRSWSFRFRHLF